jgi:pimeloyl-ACP methyl ester carboxylesterase
LPAGWANTSWERIVSEQTTTAVLVHGGFHGPWCWEPVIPGIQQVGFGVVAVELAMRTLEEDTAMVRDAVADVKRHGRVRLVGHSYAGQVITGAGHDADELVYVSAMVPDQGQSILEAIAAQLTAIPGLVFEGEQLLFTREALPAFYGCCDAPTQEWALNKMRPLAVECIAAPLPVPPAWQSVRSTYVVSTEDLLLPPSYQRGRAALMNRTVEVAADHSPFCSATNDLVAAIVSPAGPRNDM